jgi:hypothetical protein
MNHCGMAVYGHTVDHGRRWPKGSPEAGLAATPVGKTSLRVGEKRDKAMGHLSKGGNRWLIGGMRLASEGNGTRHQCLVLAGSGHG